MIDRVEKQRIMGMLRQTGLWAEADQYREQVRQRLRDEGKGKAGGCRRGMGCDG